MISAFGVEHGEISKARLIPKVKTRNIPKGEFGGAKGSITSRGKSVFLKPKTTIRASHKDVTQTTVRGGGLTDAGKLAAGTTAAAGGIGAAGTGGLIYANRKHRQG